MSTLESVIWHILGYSAIPAIILGGFAAVALICLWILSLTVDKDAPSAPSDKH
ncbi:hypothetical protein VST7929_00733 [Vibrio stylophorae]|uniref:TIGR02808 family protein n=1 Tax=Vibrio stylophorae TaxID=659351 RepID=A0ABN8DSD0_9VIBR|nr:TIGR02808 family protein [Vibrio stylophorae]CAH0532886.1 hypothetical protein VST7929_00733 [Vibrio stylophorae]